MKVRNDFVTNSSSSSFIIARHQDCSYEEVRNSVSNQREKIKNYLDKYIDYIYPDNDEIKTEYISGNKEKAVDLAIEEIAGRLYTFTGDASMNLENWSVNAEEMGDADSIFFNNIMYRFGCSFASEHMKIS